MASHRPPAGTRPKAPRPREHRPMNMGSVLVLAGLLPSRRLIEYNWVRRSGEAEEEALEEVLRHLAYAFERRSEVCLRERMRAHSRLGPDGQCASIAGVGLFREE